MATSPRPTATSRSSRRSGSCATCTSATARASTTRPAASASSWSCESCGAVRAVAPAELDAVRAAVLAAVGYRARFTHFPLAGLCPACATKGDA